MEKYKILLAYGQRQKKICTQLLDEIKDLDLSVYENKYVFALKLQQLYTALEDFFKSVTAGFENSIEDRSRFHLELLKLLSHEVPDIRPALISDNSLLLLDKLRAFRHFIRHGYNYVLEEDELNLLQNKLNQNFSFVLDDLDRFSEFLKSLSDN